MRLRDYLLASCVVALIATVGFASSAAADSHDRRSYVPPITSAVLNETPQITTEIRPIYMYNWIPGGFVTGGGYISMFAVQLRAAITERLGFIVRRRSISDFSA